MDDASAPVGPRLHVDADLVDGRAIPLSGSQSHYLSAVMRRKPEDRLRLFNGRHGEWSARIVTLERGRAVVQPMSLTREQAEEAPLLLAFAAIKREACEILVQKATEIGATTLQPLLTERSQGLRLNAARMATIAGEAAEQSERLAVPAIEAPLSLMEFLAGWRQDRPLAAAIERSGTALTAVRADALLIGPEGGFSSQELDVLGARLFVLPTSLGPTVLRAETAAIVGLTLLLAGRQ